MIYSILIAGNRGICPYCSGVMGIIGNGQTFRCIDCGTPFRIVKGGRVENELIIEAIGPEKEDANEKAKGN